MKKHTLLRNHGFAGQQHFYHLTGIGHNYQHRLMTKEPKFFEWLVKQYAPLRFCKKRINDKMEFSVIFNGQLKADIKCLRGNYVDALNRAQLSHEQIKQLIINDIPDGAEYDALIENQATCEVDSLDRLPEGK